MLQIRHGVFETNSSSSHSISVRKINEITTPEEIAEEFKWRLGKDGVLILWGHYLEFDRSPFMPLTSFFDKIRFAIASYNTHPDAIDDIKNIMFKHIPGLKSIEFDTKWGYEDEKVPDYGYIDHQSIGVLQGFLATHNVPLEEFLLNKKYVVFVDGDEYHIKEQLFESGLLHKEDFEEV